MLYYVLLKAQGEISFSPAPEVDKLWLGSFKYLRPGLPLEALKRYLQPLSLSSCLSEKENDKERKIIRLIQRGLDKDGSVLKEDFEWHAGKQFIWTEGLKHLGSEELLQEFSRMADGRQIAEGEFIFWSQKLKLKESEFLQLLHQEVIRKRGEWIEAVVREKNGWRCRRCGSSQVAEWPSLYGTAATCQGCKSIGSLTSLQVLFRFYTSPASSPRKVYLSGRSELKPQAELKVQAELKKEKESKIQESSDLGETSQWSVDFTPAQKEAAKELISFFTTGSGKEVLVWAACGAGKTEICFPLLQRYLEAGRNVLFAAPRQDVVHDLHPRLQKNFPAYRLRLLSGAAPPNWENSQLTVATTHQVLRFWQAFDLIIFDEMDAYPYRGNQVLAYGLEKALKKDGDLVYLTATPGEEILAKVSSGQAGLIRLPARHHGNPLPVPEVIKIRLPAWDNLKASQILKDKYLPALKDLAGELADKGPLLVFLPTVSLVKEWIKVFQAVFADWPVTGSWSFDPERRKKVSDFLTGQSRIFVSTSILERGITVNGLQVLVLYAQHELYDVRSLVQMAGRVGRTAENPGGRAVFVAPQETKAMATARDWIVEQNTLARKGGFLCV
ncbi:MAG TPA: DEAD/DEAH box helicase family protein [Peptococcaceae bacterium]|nr:DEAD/DEAH box helicase family protein [Peptococcaceae bacterium]